MMEIRTEADALIAVKADWKALEHVPDELLTEELCMLAIEANPGEALSVIPEWIMTEEMCLEAVKRDGLALEWVPDDGILMTPQVCWAAVSQNGSAWGAVPDDLRSNELRVLARRRMKEAEDADACEYWEDTSLGEMYGG